jgi:hypothetical protein
MVAASDAAGLATIASATIEQTATTDRNEET